MMQCSSRPSPASARASWTSSRRTWLRASRYSESPSRRSRRMTDTSACGRAIRPSGFASTSSTSHRPEAPRRSEPANRTSCPVSARSWLGGWRGHHPLDRVGDVRLPRAVRADDHGHAREEAQLDRLGERLEAADAERGEVHQPVRPSASRASASRAADCSAVFFELPRPVPSDDAVDDRGGGEVAAVRWACGFHEGVAYGWPLTCQALLQLRLVVDEGLGGVGDALVEGLDDGLRGARRSRWPRTPRRSPPRSTSARTLRFVSRPGALGADARRGAPRAGRRGRAAGRPPRRSGGRRRAPGASPGAPPRQSG